MENKNNQEDKNKPTGPKFNTYWIYGIIALFLLALNFYSMSEGTMEQVSRQKLGEMIADQDVDKLVVVNQKRGYIYIKRQALEQKNRVLQGCRKPLLAKRGKLPILA